MIDKAACMTAARNNPGLSPEDAERYKQMCADGLSIASLFRDEIPRHGTCTITDANAYLKEETAQMIEYLQRPYDMDNISVAEHVLNEDLEGEHDGLPKGYSGVSGDVKFFVEWLEGHHPSLACYFGGSNEVPSQHLYDQIAEGAIEAHYSGEQIVPLFAMPFNVKAR